MGVERHLLRDRAGLVVALSETSKKCGVSRAEVVVVQIGGWVLPEAGKKRTVGVALVNVSVTTVPLPIIRRTSRRA